MATMAASAAAAAGPPYRFVTYNVRRFTDDEGGSTVASVAESLHALAPEFVCLNEVDLDKRPEALETVAAQLGGFHIEFFGHVKGKDGFDKYGNALLSRFPPVRSERTPLDGGFMGEHNGQPYRIHRGLLAADFELPTAGGGTLPLTVAVTHLDHISEPERVTQLNHVVSALGAFSGGGPTILMGDLNAMVRSDYTEPEWAAHEQRNADAGWAAPAAGCLGVLEEAGYADAFSAMVGGGALADVKGLWRWTGHVGEPVYRIDYIWSKGGAGVVSRAVESFVATDAESSDHYPLVADLQLEVSAAAPPLKSGL